MPNVFTNARALSAHELTRLAAAVDGTFTFPLTAGGAVTPSSGLTVAVAAITGSTVTINGTLETTAYAGGTVTATTADATNPRRDLVYYDQNGAVGIAAGTPVAVSSTTGPVPPALAATQIAVAELYVAAQATTIAAGDIVDRRQAGLPLGWKLVGSNTAEQTMTSATAADLVTITGLSIPVTAPVKIVVVWRKSATAAQLSIGLKVNATVVAEADTSANTGIGLFPTTNEVQSGYSVVEFGPRSANYLRGLVVNYMASGASGVVAAWRGLVVLTNPLPDATITDIIIRGDSDGSATLGVKEVLVYQGN